MRHFEHVIQASLQLKYIAMLKHVFTLVAYMLATPATAHSYTQKSIQIGHAWGLPTESNETQAFFPLLNTGAAEDRLIALTSPAATKVTYVDRLGKAQTDLRLAPKMPIGLRKGGAHIRFTGLTRALKHGDKIPLTLTFATSGRMTIEVWIEPAPYAKQQKK